MDLLSFDIGRDSGFDGGRSAFGIAARSAGRAAAGASFVLLFALVLALASSFVLAIPAFGIEPKAGATVDLSSIRVRSWLADYSFGSFSRTAPTANFDRPKGVTLRWSKVKGARTYKVRLSRSKTLKGGRAWSTSKTSVSANNLRVASTYSWKVVAYAGSKRLKSQSGWFRTKDAPRTLKVGGVQNLRDIGGHKTVFGKRVRQGMVLRSGRLNELTSTGARQLRSGFGVRTELDLRSSATVKLKRAPLGSACTYKNVSGVYYDWNLSTASGRQQLVKELKVFVRADRYPVLVHCTAGTDRTGTLMFLLESLLGYDLATMMKDYELSFFSPVCSFGDFTVSQRLGGIRGLHRLLSTYGDEGMTYQQRVERFVLDNGMTRAQVAAIRDVLLA